MDNLAATFLVAGSGLNAQSQRIRVAAENLANAESTANSPGANPYTRKVVSFESELDEATGVSLIAANGTELDTSPYRLERIPGHPAAEFRRVRSKRIPKCSQVLARRHRRRR